MRKKYVIGNWKMNTSLEEGIELAMEVARMLSNRPPDASVGVAIAPPFTHISPLQTRLNQTPIMVAAQNCASEAKGAYTGEVSASMAKSAGAEAVILGHSERRSYYHETDGLLARKVDQVLGQGMKVIFCCGEILSERESNSQNEVVERQLRDGLYHVSAAQLAQVVIAYEPVWAIGTGLVASPAQAQEMHAFIRNSLHQKYGSEMAAQTSILYGGSCKASNAVELFSQLDVDGGLIGGAALNADEFIGIVHSF